MLIIHNGIVNLNQEWHKVDLQIDKGKIVNISASIPKSLESEHLDASNQYIIPGLIDMHVHVDDQIGRYYLADTYRSGTQIAIQNGITSLFTFITQQDQTEPSVAVNSALWKTENNLFCNVGFHFTMKSLPSLVDLYIGRNDAFKPHSIKLYTTYKKAGIYTSYHEMEEYFRYFDGKPVVFLIHCEDEAVLEQSSSVHIDPASAYYHTKLRPEQAEVKAISKVIEIAGRYDIRIHIVHVSTAESVALIDEAKCNMKITCETAPHYLFMNEEKLYPPEGHRWLCTPPLRNDQTRHALHTLAERGKIDAFATDHCAFSKIDKDAGSQDFRNVPNGIAGIGSLPYMIHKLNNDEPENSLLFMSRHLSKNPAKIMGLFPHKGIITEGADADLCILNPHGNERHVTSSLSDTYEPYLKVKTNLHFTHVLLHGNVVVKDDKLIDMHSPKGVLLCPR